MRGRPHGRSETSNGVRAVTLEHLTIGSARWTSRDVRVTGTSSATSGTVTVHQRNADGTIGAQSSGAQALTAATPPATGSSDDWHIRTGVPTTNPGQVFVTSSNGGTAGPSTVTNGES